MPVFCSPALEFSQASAREEWEAYASPAGNGFSRCFLSGHVNPHPVNKALCRALTRNDCPCHTYLRRGSKSHVDESLALQRTIPALRGQIRRVPHHSQGSRRERGIGTPDHLSVENLALLIQDRMHDYGLDLPAVPSRRAHRLREAEWTNHDRSRPMRQHFLRRHELVGIVVCVFDTIEMNLQHRRPGLSS